jgi:hypothetical protein
MDATSTFILVRFGMSAILAAGGIACIYFGYRLFRDGSGIAKAIEKIDWKSKDLKVSAAGMSVGSVLMLTSGAWAYFATNSIPKLELDGGNVKITKAPDFNQKLNWASAIGQPLVTSDKHKIGTITGVLLGKDGSQSTFVVTKNGSSPITLDAKALNFGKSGSVSVGLSKNELESLPQTITPENFQKFLKPDVKG